MTTITIPPEALEAAASAYTAVIYCGDGTTREFHEAIEAAILAALEAWNPSWTETECDNAGVIVSRVYVLDITPEENTDAEA